MLSAGFGVKHIQERLYSGLHWADISLVADAACELAPAVKELLWHVGKHTPKQFDSQPGDTVSIFWHDLIAAGAPEEPGASPHGIVDRSTTC